MPNNRAAHGVANATLTSFPRGASLTATFGRNLSNVAQCDLWSPNGAEGGVSAVADSSVALLRLGRSPNVYDASRRGCVLVSGFEPETYGS